MEDNQNQPQQAGTNIDVTVNNSGTPAAEAVSAPVMEPAVNEVASPVQPTQVATPEGVAATDTATVASEAVAATNSQETSTDNPMVTPVQPSTHKPKKPVGIIIAAVVVALLLTGVAVYAYIKTQNDSSSSDKYSLNNGSSKTDTASKEVSTDDVDTASSDVDTALKSVDETDFPTTELTDQALSL